MVNHKGKKCKRKWMDGGMLYNVYVRTRTIKQPKPHDILLLTFPVEVAEWIGEESEYVYYFEKDGRWYISRTEKRGGYKYKLNKTVYQCTCPPCFPVGKLNLYFRLNAGIISVVSDDEI